MTSKLTTDTKPPSLGRWWWLVILGVAAMLTLKYFPGLENETVYSGLAFKTIHPDAFANDTYRGGIGSMLTNPLQMSLLFGFVKLFGEIWLDDRFLVFVYLGLVFAGLAGLDKTAVLLGLKGIPERLFLLFMFAKDHAILENQVLVAHHPDVNHMAFAIPVIIWLFYAALARKGLPVVFALSVLLVALSMRNALFPVAFAHIVVFATGRRWERWVIAGLFILGLLAIAAMLMYVFPSDSGGRLGLWDAIKGQEKEDANPFRSNSTFPVYVLRTGIWMVIVTAAAWFAPIRSPGFLGVRIICLLALLTWLIGGLYISFAPDAIKVPILIGFAPTRVLAWPQNLAYIALISLCFQWLNEAPTRNRLLIVAGVFMALFINGPGHYLQWTILTLAVIAPVLVADRFIDKINIAGNITQGFAAVLVLTVLTGTAFSISARLNDWRTLAVSGVMGGNPTAEWIGIAGYLRNETPKNSVTLAYWYQNDTLQPTRSLATRSGRANVTPEFYGPGFQKPEKWQQDRQQLELLRDIGQLFTDGHLEQADSLIKKIILQPDYIVLPIKATREWHGELAEYTTLMTHGRYVILKRR